MSEWETRPLIGQLQHPNTAPPLAGGGGGLREATHVGQGVARGLVRREGRRCVHRGQGGVGLRAGPDLRHRGWAGGLGSEVRGRGHWVRGEAVVWEVGVEQRLTGGQPLVRVEHQHFLNEKHLMMNWKTMLVIYQYQIYRRTDLYSLSTNQGCQRHSEADRRSEELNSSMRWKMLSREKWSTEGLPSLPCREAKQDKDAYL